MFYFQHYIFSHLLLGSDVTPDTCITCRDQQLFITASVNYAIRMYYSATRDPDFINNPEYMPCDITKETANFLQSLAVYNQETARYDINSKRREKQLELLNPFRIHKYQQHQISYCQ